MDRRGFLAGLGLSAALLVAGLKPEFWRGSYRVMVSDYLTDDTAWFVSEEAREVFVSRMLYSEVHDQWRRRVLYGEGEPRVEDLDG